MWASSYNHSSLLLVSRFKTVVVIIFAVVYAHGSISGIDNSDVSPIELFLLQDLYNSTIGSNWTWQLNQSVYGIPWEFSAPYPCTNKWQGLTCNCSSIEATFESPYNCTIQYIDLVEYNLDGTLPISLGNFTGLKALNLKKNNLYSSIPATFGNLSSLVILDLSNNTLTGTLPPELANLILLGNFSLHNNLLSGTIPGTYSQLSSLWSFKLQNNTLTGTLPPALGSLTNLVGFDVGSNFITGTLPSSWGNNSQWYGFSVNINSMTGTIPPALMQLPNCFIFALSSNYFSSTLPDLSQLKNMQEFYVYDNILSGKVEHSFDNITSQLVIVGLDNNRFSGTLPRAFGRMKNIEQIFVDYNKFHGSIDNVFNSSLQTAMQYIELSNNAFSSTIPEEIFSMSSLLTFSATSNCFSGSIPSAVCNAKQLQTFALDGMSSARSCQIPIFRNMPFGRDAYYLARYTKGSIPTCIFNMSNLQTLHLAGNGLSANFPENLVLSDSLKDLVLSHNQMTGALPHVLQKRTWSKLDLSHNFFKDEITGDFARVYSNYSLNLQVNRLSGKVPGSWVHAKHINVLSTSLFECASHRELPQNDPDIDVYQCGSNSFEVGLLVFFSLFVIALLLTFTAVTRIYKANPQSFNERRIIAWVPPHSTETVGAAVIGYGGSIFAESSPNDDDHTPLVNVPGSTCCVGVRSVIRTWLAQFQARSPRDNKLSHSDDNIFYFKRMTDYLLRRCFYIAVYTAVLWILYESLTVEYSTYTFTYAFKGSAAFLGGELAGYCLFVGFIVLIILVYFFCDQGLVHESLSMVRNESALDNTLYDDAQVEEAWTAVQWFKLLLLLLTNFVVVVIINGVYVGVQIYSDNEKSGNNSSSVGKHITAIQLAYVAVKIFWNNVAFRNMFIRLHFGRNQATANLAQKLRLFQIEIATLMFNNIAIPCIVVMCISQQCFYDLLNPPEPVVSAFEYTYCTYFKAINGTVVCSRYSDTAVQKTSFQPPFTYSFQCSSSIVTYYGSAFLYMFIIVGMMLPLGHLMNKWIGDLLPDNRLTDMFNTRVVNRILRAVDVNKLFSSDPSDESCKPLFDNYWYSVQYSVRFAMLLTFGVTFPPLGFVMCICIALSMYFSVFAMGNLLHQAEIEGASQYRTKLENDCKYVWNPLVYTKWLLLGFMGVFYSMFVFDTIGDELGFYKTLWVLFVMPLMPLMLHVVVRGACIAHDVFMQGCVLRIGCPPSFEIGSDNQYDDHHNNHSNNNTDNNTDEVQTSAAWFTILFSARSSSAKRDKSAPIDANRSLKRSKSRQRSSRHITENNDGLTVSSHQQQEQHGEEDDIKKKKNHNNNSNNPMHDQRKNREEESVNSCDYGGEEDLGREGIRMSEVVIQSTPATTTSDTV